MLYVIDLTDNTVKTCSIEWGALLGKEYDTFHLPSLDLLPCARLVHIPYFGTPSPFGQKASLRVIYYTKYINNMQDIPILFFESLTKLTLLRNSPPFTKHYLQ